MFLYFPLLCAFSPQVPSLGSQNSSPFLLLWFYKGSVVLPATNIIALFLFGVLKSCLHLCKESIKFFSITLSLLPYFKKETLSSRPFYLQTIIKQSRGQKRTAVWAKSSLLPVSVNGVYWKQPWALVDLLRLLLSYNGSEELQQKLQGLQKSKP